MEAPVAAHTHVGQLRRDLFRIRVLSTSSSATQSYQQQHRGEAMGDGPRTSGIGSTRENDEYERRIMLRDSERSTKQQISATKLRGRSSES